MTQHINDSNSKNKVASNNDATCSGGRSSLPAPTHTSVGSKGINVNAEKKPCRRFCLLQYNSLIRDVYELSSETVKAIDGFLGGGRFSERKDA